MNYELAKKLKEAGFPQKGIYEGTTYNLSDIKKVGVNIGDVYIPTLSELIEACGDDFEVIWKGWGSTKWLAAPRTSYGDPEDYSEGCTPEEAVANLWLELNK